MQKTITFQIVEDNGETKIIRNFKIDDMIIEGPKKSAKILSREFVDFFQAKKEMEKINMRVKDI